MAKTSKKLIARRKRVKRIRKKIVGTPERPRLCVFKSNRHIYAQVIDDVAGHTLAAESTLNKEISSTEFEDNAAQAKRVGELIADKAKSKGVEKVIFDRGGCIYHGLIKALSDGAREKGLVF
jgi:large subunit ribosomal protein L18